LGEKRRNLVIFIEIAFHAVFAAVIPVGLIGMLLGVIPAPLETGLEVI